MIKNAVYYIAGTVNYAMNLVSYAIGCVHGTIAGILYGIITGTYYRIKIELRRLSNEGN